MERWIGILKVPLNPNSRTYYRVGASLCLSISAKTLIVPSANAIFFNGDRVQGTGNKVVERLSDLQMIAEILVSKFGSSVNAWVIEASDFSGPFAVYKDFVPSVNSRGEPESYSPVGFPASTATVSLLSNCFKEAKRIISRREREPFAASSSESCFDQLKTIILGFSKGGTVLNQLVSELGFTEAKSARSADNVKERPMSRESSTIQEETRIIPRTMENLLSSIAEIHYVDVGLNSAGAYINDRNVIERISKRLAEESRVIRFVLHGTPRQWCDSRRVWIRNEKDKLVNLLDSEARKNGGNLQVCERFYFADRPPDMQMHFEIIESMDVS
ncbi:hypothetical protein Ddye_018285 [Dipteronia dyeriana]|uniref:Uncharacterized protein n=1 Tax=Dipteronia dyeriana TaxID=168575 RepID=A0AAD9UAR9_9ROSI|nr:hypothetical protein Ddye_018285 [Dipteronia dyeriana]